MTDPAKAKIQELCPDVMEYKNVGLTKGRWKCECGATNGSIFTACQSCRMEKPKVCGDITLAVVLRAIEKLHPADWFAVDTLGSIWKGGEKSGEEEIVGRWNLTEDNYDDQAEETRAFIGSLLGV
jgi:hypothetical protein